MNLNEFDSKKILIIEKDKTQVRSFQDQFSYTTAQLEFVKNHEQALDKLKNEKFDHLVMNLHMKNTNLTEFLKSIDHLVKENNHFIIRHSDLVQGKKDAKASEQPAIINELFEKEDK